MHVCHYRFPPADGPTSEGVCACGAIITGRNSMEAMGVAETYGHDVAQRKKRSRAAAGSAAAAKARRELMAEHRYPDGVLLALYRAYSEELWAAGFMSPDTQGVQRFKLWLEKVERAKAEEDYEQKMLRLFYGPEPA